MRRIVVCENPASLAIERIDQCVASAGLARRVRSDDLGNPIVLYRARPARAGLVKQTVEAILLKAPAPLAHRMLMATEFPRHHLVRQAFRATKNDPAALRKGARRSMTTDLPLQIVTLLHAQKQPGNRAAALICRASCSW